MELKEGIIIKAVEYKENSKIITILTANGLDTLLTRAALSQKSKTFAYSQELTKIAYSYTARNENDLKILTSGKVISNYTAIKHDFSKLNDTMLIFELIIALGSHIEDSFTFYNFVSDILDLINNQENQQYYLVIFKIKILYLLGIGPQFTRCVSCGNHNDLIGFVFLAGGMKCRNCMMSNDVILNKETALLFKNLYLTKLPDITQDILNLLPNRNNILDFIDHYYEHYLGFYSKANKIIKKM